MKHCLNIRDWNIAFQKPFGLQGAPSSLADESTRTRQLNKENTTMKRTLLAIAISVAATGYACAQAYDDQVLAPVVVEHVDVDRLVQNCTPPSAAPECASFHALIRQSFSEREIGMLFGAATAYPEYRTSYNSVRERYESLLRYVEDNGLPVVAMVDEPVRVVSPTPAVYEDTTTVTTYGIPSDQNAVITNDDPDAQVLGGQPAWDDDEDLNDEVVYYDDDDDALPPPPPRRQ